MNFVYQKLESYWGSRDRETERGMVGLRGRMTEERPSTEGHVGTTAKRKAGIPHKSLPAFKINDVKLVGNADVPWNKELNETQERRLASRCSLCIFAEAHVYSQTEEVRLLFSLRVACLRTMPHAGVSRPRNPEVTTSYRRCFHCQKGLCHVRRQGCDRKFSDE